MHLCFSAPFGKTIFQTKKPLVSWLPPPCSFFFFGSTNCHADQTNDWCLLAFPVLFFVLSWIGMPNYWHPEQPGILSASLLLCFGFGKPIKQRNNEGTIRIASPLFFFCCHSSQNDILGEQMLLCFSVPFLFWQTDLPNKETIGVPAPPSLQLLLFCLTAHHTN